MSEFGGVDVSVAVLVEDLESLEEVLVRTGVGGLGNGPEDGEEIVQSDSLLFHVGLGGHVLLISTSQKN